MVANADNYSKSGTHRWSVLDIEPKADIFFSKSFVVDGLKNFVIQDDKKVI